MPVSTEPLLLEEESANGHASRRQTPLWRHFAVAGCLVAYVLLGAIERVSFARMASAMSTGVVLMHTLLCVCTLLLFVLLQLARNQSGPPISEQLERLHMGDVLSMTLLDVLHTLLALAGATLIPGVVQALLLQGTVPAITLFSALLTNGSGSGGGSSRSRSSDSSGGGSDHGSSADSNSGGGGGSGGGRDGSGGSKNRQQTLTLWQWLNHLINHSSLSQCMCQLASSPTCYQLVASIAIAATVISVALTPPLSAAPAPTPLRALKWPDLAAIAIGATSTEAAPADGSLAPDGPTSANTAGDAMLGRRLFLASTALSALASVHKRRCLERRPVDLLVLNTCLSAVQLMVGLVIAPPLLMVLASRPIRDTLVQLARGLRCCMSGFNPNICAADNSDAFGTPHLLTFFIASTAWNAASFALLRLGGEAFLAVGSAVILPTTILAFCRPTPLPYSWAAPPEPLSSRHAILAACLVAALVVYHIAAVLSVRGGKARGQRAVLVPMRKPHRPHGSQPESRVGSPAALVGPSLHL